MLKFTFKLVQPARKSGGDKYAAQDFSDNGRAWEVYFPQTISRKDGVTIATLKMTVEG